MEFDCDSGITNGLNVAIVPSVWSISNNDLLTHQRVDQVVCRERGSLGV